MRKLLLTLPIMALLIFGCSTAQRRISYNTLATVGYTTDTAVKGYLDLVIKGQLSTNTVPVIARDYQIYQAAYGLALKAAQFDTNAFAPHNVIELSGVVIRDIDTAKGLQ